MRVPLTKKMVKTLQSARKATGLSQYVLADRLGWKRSKIKRVEKGEVATIVDADYREYLAMCRRNGWKDPKFQKKLKEFRGREKRPGAELRGPVSKYFTQVREMPQRAGSCMDFVQVTLAKDLPKPENVLDQKVNYRANRLRSWVSRTLVGVEFVKEQLPLKKGAVVELALHPK